MAQLKKIEFGTREFLELVWPDEGFYCVAHPFNIPGSGAQVYSHRVFQTVDDAIAYIKRTRTSKDVFFAVHTLAEERVWNERKIDYKTGEPGAWQVRVARNMLQSKAFFLDIDVGKDDTYATQMEAAQALLAFCKETHLPRPYVVVSGGGLHIYWVLDESITSTEWAGHAAKLKALTEHHGLHVDPVRTADAASVLRPVGTYNHKNPQDPREVYVAVRGVSSPPETFVQLLDAAVIRSGVEVRARAHREQGSFLGAGPANVALLGDNMSETFKDSLVSFEALVRACPQVQHAMRQRKTLEQSHWYGTLGLMPYVEDGERYAHKISRDHPDYIKEETDAKLAQWKAASGGPTTCHFFQSRCAAAKVCDGCRFNGKVTSPIVAARRVDELPPPVVEIPRAGGAQGETLVVEIPPAPKPFIRLKSGGVATQVVTAEGDEVQVKFIDYDLYPVRRIVNETTNVEQQVWVADLPRRGAREFVIDADTPYDARKFSIAMSNIGIYFDPANFKHLQAYMIAYIKQLQIAEDAESQIDHIGWDSKDQQAFYLPDRVIHRGGDIEPVRVTPQVESAVRDIGREGTLEVQQKLMEFYASDNYIAHQFFLLGGLASVLYASTGHYGVVVNAYGEAGSSKSTALYTAASFWGMPDQYPLNGTQHGVTAKARLQRVHILANLPFCVDEITHMQTRDASDLAMSVTQPQPQVKLNRDSTEKIKINSFKSSMLLSTSNASVHNMLSMDNAAGTAGSMRVIEIYMQSQRKHKKHEADEYMHALKRNYGHIGPRFVEIIMRNFDKVEQLVRYWAKKIDEVGDIQQSERFWSAGAAATLAAATISYKAKLLPYDPVKLFDWFIYTQLPSMRAVVGEEYSTPQSILADFIEASHDHIIVTQSAGTDDVYATVLRPPRGSMVGHFDKQSGTLWLLKKAFKDYCVRIGANSNRILDELNQKTVTGYGPPSPVVLRKVCKKILGANTEHGKGQSRCIEINMAHPAISGKASLTVVEPATPRATNAVEV